MEGQAGRAKRYATLGPGVAAGLRADDRELRPAQVHAGEAPRGRGVRGRLRGREILAGRALEAAAQLERAATDAGLQLDQRGGIDDAISHLTGKAPYLAYDKALTNGWRIATGVIEGACRHLI